MMGTVTPASVGPMPWCGGKGLPDVYFLVRLLTGSQAGGWVNDIDGDGKTLVYIGGVLVAHFSSPLGSSPLQITTTGSQAPHLVRDLRLAASRWRGGCWPPWPRAQSPPGTRPGCCLPRQCSRRCCSQTEWAPGTWCPCVHAATGHSAALFPCHRLAENKRSWISLRTGTFLNLAKLMLFPTLRLQVVMRLLLLLLVWTEG